MCVCVDWVMGYVGMLGWGLGNVYVLSGMGKSDMPHVYLLMFAEVPGSFFSSWTSYIYVPLGLKLFSLHQAWNVRTR